MAILKLKPSCKDYLWGGTRLRTEFGIEYDRDPLAESWELSCHPDGPSYIVNGEYAGKTLQQYIDENGKKQDLSWDGVYIAPDGTKFTPNIWFMIKAQEKLTTFKRTAAKVIPIVVIVVIVALIYLWFRLWCIREDKRMEALYGNKEQKKLANN